jgi:hypothetical protein
VFFSCCDSVASPQATIWAQAGLGTMIKYARRTASGAAGNDLGNNIKYLRRTENSAAGNGLGTIIMYLQQTTAAGNRIAITTKYLRGTAGIGLGTKIKYRAQRSCVDPKIPPCAHKQNPHQHSFPFASAAQNYTSYILKNKHHVSLPLSSPPRLHLIEPYEPLAPLALPERQNP